MKTEPPDPPPQCPRCKSHENVVVARNYGREIKPRRWWCMQCGWLSD